MVRIKTTEFTRLDNPELCDSAQEKVNAVVANATLSAEIFPGTALVQTSIDNLSDLNVIGEHGTPAQKNDRDQARAVLISYLFQWVGFFIQKAALLPTEQEGIDFVEDYFFVPVLKGGAIGHLTAVENPRAKSASNAIQVNWSRKKGAQSYRLMKTTGLVSEESVWVEETITTRCKVSVSAPAGTMLSFAIYPIGSAGIGDVSEYITGVAGM